MTLRAEALVKIYQRRSVVDGLTLQVEPGRIVGLLGPNGAGKTTTFHMMIGFIAADAGRVLLEDADISGLPFFRRARLGIGYLPQEPSVFTQASVVENLDLALEWFPSAKERAQLREQLLAEFGLQGLRAQEAKTLSSGARRRWAIARSLAPSPRVTCQPSVTAFGQLAHMNRPPPSTYSTFVVTAASEQTIPS